MWRGIYSMYKHALTTVMHFPYKGSYFKASHSGLVQKKELRFFMDLCLSQLAHWLIFLPENQQLIHSGTGNLPVMPKCCDVQVVIIILNYLNQPHPKKNTWKDIFVRKRKRLESLNSSGQRTPHFFHRHPVTSSASTPRVPHKFSNSSIDSLERDGR